MIIESMTDAIGNTPLLRIPDDKHNIPGLTLYAKLEMLNPFGSIKDRTAWGMLRPQLEDLNNEDTELPSVIELSSGNTAKALAVLSGMHGLKFRSITNRMKVREVKDVLQALGATIDELPGNSECLDPGNASDPLTVMYEEITRSGKNHIHTNQYFNEDNTQEHYHTTGQEILDDLGSAPDYFVACVGTSGSSAGCATKLREQNPGMNVIGLVGEKGDFLPGIRNMDEVHEVGLFDPTHYNDLQQVGVEAALDGMETLIRELGVLSGPTGGAAYAGAVSALRDLVPNDGTQRTAVFVVCDRMESYMSYLHKRRPHWFDSKNERSVVPSVTADDVAKVPSIAAGEAVEWAAENRAHVIDLRGNAAYAALKFPGSLNIAETLFVENLDAGMPFDPQQPLLLICPIGARSAQQAAVLTAMGHQNVYSLDGGMTAWRDASRPTRAKNRSRRR